MKKLSPSLVLILTLILYCYIGVNAQINTPVILDVTEDDRVATINWNSKVYSLQARYDKDKQEGVYSYLLEWGPEDEGFIYSSITPYRAAMVQPLVPGVKYVARVYNLDEEGRKSDPSNVIEFQHNSERVDEMRNRLNGFFDDMNYPMGAFPEKDWNQSYSGCMKIGTVSQHINNQFHGHNVQSSGACDRGIACSRVRHLFDYTDRTGTIEFDLDGSQRNRQFWYLDVIPADKKRDLTGHIQLGEHDHDAEDPPYLLRIIEKGSRVSVQQFDAEGHLHELDNIYENEACGEHLEFCDEENLSPLINVRRRWRIELSKDHLKIFINEKPVIDANLRTEYTPDGLPFEVAQLNWLTFSYNTPKENFLVSMIHWDNFGFDAPEGYTQSEVVHNYTDGILGTETPRRGNEFSVGMYSTPTEAGISTIRIPDNLKDLNGNNPVLTELMFTIQGSDYEWTDQDRIMVNGHEYNFPEPSSTIPGFAPIDLTKSSTPYSALIELDPEHLVVGENQVEFYLNEPRLLNIHIECTYPIESAPAYTPPSEAYQDHIMKLMDFRTIANTMGPGIEFEEINGERLGGEEFRGERNPTEDIKYWSVKQTPVSGILSMKVRGNSEGQLAATGKASGITHYEILIDNQVAHTVRTDIDSPVAYFEDIAELNTENFSNGIHQLSVQAYDINGNISTYDAFEGGMNPGDYRPVIIDIQNTTTSTDDVYDILDVTIFPNPTTGNFTIIGNLSNYKVNIYDVNGRLVRTLKEQGNSSKIELNDVGAGLYFAHIHDMDKPHSTIKKIFLTK